MNIHLKINAKQKCTDIPLALKSKYKNVKVPLLFACSLAVFQGGYAFKFYYGINFTNSKSYDNKKKYRTVSFDDIVSVASIDLPLLSQLMSSSNFSRKCLNTSDYE